jgi:nucleotide-binding universal stress UspA family protein
MRQIMVPTDGSTLSARALPVAEALARAQDAEIVLVRVIEPIDFYGMSVESYFTAQVYDELVTSLHLAARADLGTMVEAIKGRGGSARFIVLAGSPAAGLLDSEANLQPDLIVMGSHGWSGLSRFALGSVTDRLVREGSTPVLVVHGASPADGVLESALVTLDGSPVAELALPMAHSLAGKPLRHFQLLRVVATRDDLAPAREYLDRVATRLTAQGVTVSTDVQIDEPAPAIAAAALGVDLVILATHGRGGIDRVRHGSVAEAVTRQVPIPVLLVRTIPAHFQAASRQPVGAQPLAVGSALIE